MGALSLKPGVTNVVPAFAELTLEKRDLQQEQIDMLDEALLRLAHECGDRQGVATAMQIQSDLTTMLVAQRIPTAMLFISSIGDRSHSADEDSAETQIKTGARVFIAAVISRVLPTLGASA